MAKENTLLLTLPNVTLICENESGGDPVEETEVTGKSVLGQHESVVEEDGEDGVGGDNEQYSCHQHITSTLKKERASSELQDLYKLLMQLPSFSHTTWSGFGSSSQSTIRKNPPPTSTTKPAGKIRKTYITRKERKVGTQASTQNMDSFEDDIDKGSFQTEIGNQNHQRNREVIKLHSINLYQSILPSSLFSNMNHRRKPT